MTNYHRVDATCIEFLVATCGSDRVFSGDAIGDDYTHDEMVEYGKFSPEVVVEPESSEEIAAIARYANSHDIPITPRGSGTGLCGGAVAIRGGILLSTLRMNRILELDENNLTVTVEPGVLLMDLAKAVADKGFLYPPDPGEKSATIGGNVMTNAGGMRAVKYGVTRDYVRALDIVTANGEILELGGKVAKNSSGYGLRDILIGSEGTLGIVTKIVLRLLPLPARTISLLVPFHELDACISAVPAIIKSKSIPTAIEFMTGEVIEAAEKYLGKQFPDKSSAAYLLLSFDGESVEEIERAYDRVAKICLELGALDVFISDTDERQESIWSARGAFLEAIKSSTTAMDECDVVVPRDRIADFVRFVSEVSRKHSTRIPCFGHAGDGNLHIYACKDEMDDTTWEQKRLAIMDEFYAMAETLHGKVSGEHGIGHAKAPYLRASAGDAHMELMRAVKSAFDPKGILNPGKVVR